MDIFKKISDLINRNAHTEARIEAAKYLNCINLTKAYEYILKEHSAVGHLTSDMCNLRDCLDHNLFIHADRSLGDQDCKKFYACF